MVFTESLLHTSLFRHWQAKSWTFWMLIMSHLFSSCPQSFACQDKNVGFSQRLNESKLSLIKARWVCRFPFSTLHRLILQTACVCISSQSDQKQIHHQIVQPAFSPHLISHLWSYTVVWDFTESSHKPNKDVRCKVSAEWLLTVSKLPLCMSSMGGRKRSASVLSFLSTVPPLRSSCSWRTRKRTFEER